MDGRESRMSSAGRSRSVMADLIPLNFDALGVQLSTEPILPARSIEDGPSTWVKGRDDGVGAPDAPVATPMEDRLPIRAAKRAVRSADESMCGADALELSNGLF